VTSTDAAANGLNTNTELCGDGSQANSASLVGGADGRTPRVMDCWPTDRPAALAIGDSDLSMSALAQFADSGRTSRKVREVPKGDKPHRSN
jgi:hypothetical protein